MITVKCVVEMVMFRYLCKRLQRTNMDRGGSDQRLHCALQTTRESLTPVTAKLITELSSPGILQRLMVELDIIITPIFWKFTLLILQITTGAICSKIH